MIEKLSLTCDGRLSHRQLACCHSYCGLPLDGKDMLIYSNVDKKLEVCSSSVNYELCNLQKTPFGLRKSIG